MHPEAFAGFGRAMQRAGIDRETAYRVLDVGGQNVNGTVHGWFSPETEITTLDLENADIIADARTWEPDRLFDIVIATEVFEHVENWCEVIGTMRKALDPDGPGVLIATCASTNRPRHGATGAPLPVDDEYYANVDPQELDDCLRNFFRTSVVEYCYPPGDAYMWGRL